MVKQFCFNYTFIDSNDEMICYSLSKGPYRTSLEMNFETNIYFQIMYCAIPKLQS